MLRLIADEDDIEDLEIDDLAEVKPANFEKHQDSWRYYKTPPPSGGPLGDCSHIDLDCTPKDVDVSRARAFFNAARIHAGIIYPRARKNRIWQEQHDASIAPPPATEEVLLHAPTDPTRNVNGEMVNMGDTLDGRSTRLVPVLDVSVFNRGLEHYKYMCWGEPPEDIRPSLAQFSAVMEGKRMKSMYCDYANFAPHDTRIV